jgi:biotin carboxyl carrier protein
MKNFKFTIKGHDYEVEIKDFENNLAEVEVNGTIYQVEVQREVKASKTPVLVRPEPVVSRSERKFKKVISSQTEVKAPLPGNILKIFVHTGDEVKKGDKLLMYEAMKMENLLTAEKEGIVQKIKVREGDSVLQDDILMTISL